MLLNKISLITTLDPCANVECEGDSNRCVEGTCVCGSLSGVCPETTPICFGNGEAATCSCHAGSCAEPNPVCALDGTCKVIGVTSYFFMNYI